MVHTSGNAKLFLLRFTAVILLMFQKMWDLWLTQRNGDRCFCEYLSFPLSVSLDKIKRNHTTFQYSRRYLLFVADSVVKLNITVFCLKCLTMRHKQPRCVSFSYFIHFWLKILLFRLQDFYICSSVKQAVNIQMVFTSCAFSSLTHFYFLPSISQFICFIPLIFSLIHRIKSHFCISDGTNVPTFPRKLFT